MCLSTNFSLANSILAGFAGFDNPPQWSQARTDEYSIPLGKIEFFAEYPWGNKYKFTWNYPTEKTESITKKMMETFKFGSKNCANTTYSTDYKVIVFDFRNIDDFRKEIVRQYNNDDLQIDEISPRFLADVKDMEANAVACLGSMIEASYEEFEERMLDIAHKAGIVKPEMAITLCGEPYPISKMDWDFMLKSAKTDFNIPKVFVVDGSKFYIPVP